MNKPMIVVVGVIYFCGGSSLYQYLRWTLPTNPGPVIVAQAPAEAAKKLQDFFKSTQTGSNAFITGVSSL